MTSECCCYVTEGLTDLSDIEQGVQHIIVDVMAKDIRVIENVRQL